MNVKTRDINEDAYKDRQAYFQDYPEIKQNIRNGTIPKTAILVDDEDPKENLFESTKVLELQSDLLSEKLYYFIKDYEVYETSLDTIFKNSYRKIDAFETTFKYRLLKPKEEANSEMNTATYNLKELEKNYHDYRISRNQFIEDIEAANERLDRIVARLGVIEKEKEKKQKNK